MEEPELVVQENSRAANRRGEDREPMFPAYLGELAGEGITSYKVDLSRRSIVFYGRGSENVEKERRAERLPGKAFAIENIFNKELLKDAWRENNYPRFLSEIARAGVGSYRVDTSARTITYFGRGKSYTETIPQPE